MRKRDLIKRLKKLRDNPVLFAEVVLGFKPFPYQQKLLQDKSKRIVACMGRQTGKTTVNAIKAIHFAYCNPKTLVLIVSPSLRQSMIMFDRILDLIYSNPWLPKSVVRKTRTLIHLDNNSRIVALPCSANLLRGYTANLIICLPSYAKIMLANGVEVPISKIKEGQEVFSFNEQTQKLEPRKVIRVISRLYYGNLCLVSHDFGSLVCTPEHKVFTENRGYTNALMLTSRDKLLCLSRRNKIKENGTSGQTTHQPSRANSVWRAPWRLFPFKNKEKQKKQLSTNTAFLKTSRVCSIQISGHEGFRQNSAAHSEKQRLGKRISEVLHACIPSIHKSAPNLLQKQSKNNNFRMAFKNNISPCLSNLVHGRWKPASQFNDDHKHACFFFGRTETSQEVAGGSVERLSQDNGRRSREGLLFKVPCQRKRQIHGVNSALYHSKYELQSNPESALRQMPNLRERIHPQKKCLRKCPNNGKKADLPKPKVQKHGAFKTILQSPAYAMQSLRENLRTSHRQPSHMQQRMQSPILFTAQARMGSSLQNEKEIKVYNLTVEGNHNYFADGILVKNCDEAAFMPEEVITKVMFPMLSTTQGNAIFLSTPWGRDHFSIEPS